MAQAIARLQQVSSKAVETLVTVMESTLAAPSARVTAATKVLELAIKAVELEDLEARITLLEQWQRQMSGGEQ